MFNNFKVSLAPGIKTEIPNSIFIPISYHYTNSFPHSPFTSDKHTGLDIEISPSGTLPSYEYIWQTGTLDALFQILMSQFPWEFCNIMIKQKLIHSKTIVFLHKAALNLASTIPLHPIKKNPERTQSMLCIVLSKSLTLQVLGS